MRVCLCVFSNDNNINNNDGTSNNANMSRQGGAPKRFSSSMSKASSRRNSVRYFVSSN